MPLRTPEDEAVYQQAKRDKQLVPINSEQPIESFLFWQIVSNRFPHSRLAKVNHMLVLRRKAVLDDITDEEWLELLDIIKAVQDRYDIALYNFPSMSSVKDVPHIHLEVLQDEYR